MEQTPIIPNEITKERIYAALKDVYDPEIPVSIVDLGLVYDVKIIDDWVGVKDDSDVTGVRIVDRRSRIMSANALLRYRESPMPMFESSGSRFGILR
jgi:hypothetical protein